MVDCPSVRSGRTLTSTHGTWENARAGALAYIAPQYNYPDPYLLCSTYLTASYFINRAHLTLDTQQVKSKIVAARLKFYVVALDIQARYLYITKGAHSDIVDPSVWAAQNGNTDIGGQKLFSDLVLDAWNEIPLTATGIAWINSDPSEKKQYEGFDDGGNTDLLLYAPYRQCMSFTPVDAHPIKTLKLYAKKLAAGCGTVTVNIKAADINHFPTGAALASGEFDSGTLTTAYDWLVVSLGDGASLSAETEYCYELIPAGGDAANQAKFYADSSGIYVRGQNAYYDGGWVAQPNYDMYFLEYNDEDVGGTRLCLRTEWDLNDVPPTIAQTTGATFRAYDPILEVDLAPGALGKARGFELRGSGFRP